MNHGNSDQSIAGLGQNLPSFPSWRYDTNQSSDISLPHDGPRQYKSEAYHHLPQCQKHGSDYQDGTLSFPSIQAATRHEAYHQPGDDLP